nr:hypothetical protein [Tanacetum cinerariifolium]
ALLENITLYDNESWNDSRDFAKPMKAISLPQDVQRTSDHRLIEFKNQVQLFMEAHLALMQPTQWSHETQYCIEDLEQAFVEYASSCIDKAGGFFGVSVTKLTTSRLVNGSSCGGSDMVIKDLDLEKKIDAMMRDFLDFFIIAVQTLGSGISILLAVGTPFTGSGNLYCQWKLSTSSGNALCILFPT